MSSSCSVAMSVRAVTRSSTPRVDSSATPASYAKAIRGTRSTLTRGVRTTAAAASGQYRRPPITAQIRAAHFDGADHLVGPREGPLLQAFVEDPESGAIPRRIFKRSPRRLRNKKMSRQGIEAEVLAHHGREAIDRPSQVRRSGGQVRSGPPARVSTSPERGQHPTQELG